MECELKQEFHAMPPHTHTQSYKAKHTKYTHRVTRDWRGWEQQTEATEQKKHHTPVCCVHKREKKKLIKTINIIRVICRIRWNESEMPIVIKAMSKIATDRARSFNEKKNYYYIFPVLQCQMKVYHSWMVSTLREKIHWIIQSVKQNSFLIESVFCVPESNWLCV